MVVTAVKAHLWGIGTVGARMELAYLFKAHDLGPKRVRLFKITDIQHQMVDPHRGHRLPGWSRDVITLCHWHLLLSLELSLLMRIHEDRGGAKRKLAYKPRARVMAGRRC